MVVEDWRVPDLEYRSLGRSGLRVTTVGLGCNNFGRAKTATETQEGTTAVVSAAIDAGITLFDTADIYGSSRGLSETLMGNALKGRRHEIVLATKFGMDMQGANGPDWGARGSRRYIRIAVESSLKRLQTDWIDLYQLHQPDPLTPIEETLAALDELVRRARCATSGTRTCRAGRSPMPSTSRSWPGTRSSSRPRTSTASSSAASKHEVLPAVNATASVSCRSSRCSRGSSRASTRARAVPPDGRLTVIRPELLTAVDWDAMDRYQAFCDERGITMLEATFGWFLAQRGVTSVIAGATKPEQVVQNVAAGTAWTPSADEAAHISAFFPR